MKQHLIAVCGLAAILLLGAGANSENSQPAPSLDFEKLGAMSRQDMSDALTAVMKSRGAMESEVVFTLRLSDSKQAKIAAVAIAGYFRLEAVIPDLVANIDFYDDQAHPPNVANTYTSMYTSYPAVDALWRIGGDRVVTALVAKLEETDDMQVRKLAGLDLMGILGSDVAKFVVQKEIDHQAEAKNSTVIVRLKAALPFLDEPK